MKVALPYGPAATGKLTVAREPGGFAGYPVFHNRMVADALDLRPAETPHRTFAASPNPL